VNFVRLFP